MKLRRASPLLLALLAPGLTLGQQVAAPLQDHGVTALGEPAATTAAVAATATKAYVGTADAPVDGRDGKPHAGPFVDWDSAAAKAAVAGAGGAPAEQVAAQGRGLSADIP